jgi:uncharacterized protein YegJ (DUF2314 family)
MDKKILVLFALSLTLLACSVFNLAGEYGNVKSVNPSNEEMNAAIQQARETLPLFINELQNPKTSQSLFSVKAKFLLDDGGAEHLWIDDVTYNNNQFTGTLGNEPLYVRGHHLGETITVGFEDVTDWMLIDNDHLIGGFTMHVFLNYMSEDEISQFESESGYTVGDEPSLP